MTSLNDDSMFEDYRPSKNETRGDLEELSPVDQAFLEAKCDGCVETPGDPRYAYIDPINPDPATFYDTLDLSRFERTGLSGEDLDTLKKLAFGCAYFLSFPTRPDKWGKDGEPDNHEARSEWVRYHKGKPWTAEFHKRYIANRLRPNSMSLMLSRIADFKAFIQRYEIMPMKAELQAVFDALPSEITSMPDPAGTSGEMITTSAEDMPSRIDKFKQRYVGQSDVPPQPAPAVGNMDKLMAALEKVPYEGKKAEELTPFLLADKKRVIGQFEEAANRLLAILERHEARTAATAA